jgi:hypothetical protein
LIPIDCFSTQSVSNRARRAVRPHRSSFARHLTFSILFKFAGGPVGERVCLALHPPFTGAAKLARDRGNLFVLRHFQSDSVVLGILRHTFGPGTHSERLIFL